MLRIFFILAYFIFTIPLYSLVDLTLVGFIEPEGGIGKVPVTIIETLKNQVSMNLIATAAHSSKDVPYSVKEILDCQDSSPGKVALLTDLLWDCGRNPYTLVPQASVIKLAYSMLETTAIPTMWVKILNEEFDAVVVPDQFLVSVYENSGVHIPIFVLPIPMILAPYFAHPIHAKSASTPFIFGDASANKNPAILVEAFARAFGNNEDVQLVMRAGRIFPETREIIHRIVHQFGLMNVKIEEGHALLEQHISRLSSFDCYVNLSRGEGFSFIPRECLALGLPVIITNNTASKTICKSDCVRAVPCRKKGPSNFNPYKLIFNEECGEQFDCEVEDVIIALRDVYDHYANYVKKARKGREWVKQYDVANLELQEAYATLIKPKVVVLGNQNRIKKGRLMTNSRKLYQKYQQIIHQS